MRGGNNLSFLSNSYIGSGKWIKFCMWIDITAIFRNFCLGLIMASQVAPLEKPCLEKN